MSTSGLFSGGSCPVLPKRGTTSTTTTPATEPPDTADRPLPQHATAKVHQPFSDDPMDQVRECVLHMSYWTGLTCTWVSDLAPIRSQPAQSQQVEGEIQTMVKHGWIRHVRREGNFNRFLTNFNSPLTNFNSPYTPNCLISQSTV